MAKELIINASLPEVRIALLEEGRIQELLIERASEKGIVGNIYKGRVTRVLPGMQAAFVDVGLEKAAFLYVDDIYVHPKVMGEEVESHQEEYEDSNEEHTQEASDRQSVEEHAEQQAGEQTNQNQNEENSDTDQERIHASSHEETQASAEEQEAAEAFTSEMEFSDEDSSEDDSEEDDEDEDSEEDDSDDQSEDEEDENEELDAQAQSNSSDLSLSEEGRHSEEALSASAQSEASGDANPSVEGSENAAPGALQGLIQPGGAPQRPKRFRRGRNRRGKKDGGAKEGQGQFAQSSEGNVDPNLMPESLNESLADRGNVGSDRASMDSEANAKRGFQTKNTKTRPEFREQRNRDRRIKSKSARPRAPANISDLLKEGQEVIVQIAKDPIATKGARLTCHVSLPGRHLVCMPTIDHVGVSRRIEREDERRSLRNFVERNRPRKMGFIVRTASGGKDPESWIKQDIDYLSKLWREIRTRSDDVSAPAMVYEDLNSVLRAIRDWVNEDISKIIVDSRYHYNELMAFAERFMPQLMEIIELYQGDIPIFDAYGISSELHRSLERKVWLKSGGSIVIDQAEALVAIDVNTGRYVGKKSLEDTILKTNMEAAEEIAHQLRLRNCGGIIIVDFIDMERDENRMRVYRALDEALKKDRARPTIQKISELGLVEMTRKRTRDTIIRTLCEPCTHCEGKGFSKSTRTVAYEILREMERLGVDREAKKILVSAHEQVIDILAIDFREIVDSLERRYNKQVYLQAIMDFHAEQFEVLTDRMQGKKQNQDIARQLRIDRERSERKEKTKQRQKEVVHVHRETGITPAGGPSPFIQRNKEPQIQTHTITPVDKSATVMANTGIDDEVSAEEAYPSTAGDTEAPQRVQRPAIIGNANSNPGNSGPRPQQHRAAPTGMEDEDQLAYLRAQAAQDAALATLNQGAVSPSIQNQGGGRPNNRNQNNRGGGQNQQRNGGGRNDRNQNRGQGNPNGGQNNNRNRNNPRGAQGGGQRPMPSPNGGGGIIRPVQPQQLGNEAQPQSAPVYVEPQEVQVPDYEVLVKSDGEGSQNT